MIKHLFVSLLCFFLFACSNDDSGVESETNTPEIAATRFFEAIYHNKDVKLAAKHCTGSLRRVVLNYGSARAVQRNLLNMPFDEVDIKLDKTGTSLRNEFGTEALVSFMFEGHIYGDKKIDMKAVFMVKEDGEWLVKEIKSDPFS